VRVGVFLVSMIRPSSGGQFSYFERLIHAIDNHQFNEKLDVCFVGRASSGKVPLRKKYFRISPFIFYLGFWALEKYRIVSFFSRLFFTNANLCNRLDKYLLRKYNVDVLLIPKQTYNEVENFPFITMNWDAGHKSTFAFPELIIKGSFETREKWYQKEMQKALAVFVESETGKNELAEYFSISKDKIEVVPLFAGKVTDIQVPEQDQQKILGNYAIKKNRFFFYPAQFWAHKNHYNLLAAFGKVVADQQYHDVKLVFTGSDKGNKKYVLNVIQSLGLAQHVIVKDFVSNEEINTLYRNAVALVMPTFLGPTNMPLLEAQILQTAIICTDLKGHREMCGDGAIYIDPQDENQISHAMISVMNDNVRSQVISRANLTKNTSKFNIATAIRELEKGLIKFRSVRKTFL
jgi:glycosyltransferase involved in cell wall biosynthesis